MDLWEVKFSTPDEKSSVTGFVRANTANDAVNKILRTTPALIEFYRIDIKERPDAFIVTED